MTVKGYQMSIDWRIINRVASKKFQYKSFKQIASKGLDINWKLVKDWNKEANVTGFNSQVTHSIFRSGGPN